MPTINGDDGSNTLEDTSGNDIINALGGDDFITVKHGGIDEVYGGAGFDRLILDFSAYAGPITMTAPFTTPGGGPSDRNGEVYEGQTRILTYDSINQIYVTGSAGNDVLYGVDRYQPLGGNSGNDILDGGPGADIMRGGKGSDTYYVDDPGDQIIEFFQGFDDAGSVDVMYTALTTYTVPSGVEKSFFTTNADHVVFGSSQVHTGSGNDIIYNNGGASGLGSWGGAGNDIYVRPSGTIELAGEGTDIIFAQAYTLSPQEYIEVLAAVDPGSTVHCDLRGNALDQWIYGGAGNDWLIDGGGRDVLTGRAGDDLYIIAGFRSIIVEAAGEGNDTVQVNATEYALNEGASIETLSSDHQNSNLAQNLWGNSFDQLVSGTNGKNVLDGGGGVDTLVGFKGDDIYFVDNAGDTVVEAAFEGVDTIYVNAPISYTLAAGVSVEILSVSNHSFTTAINLTGNELNNNVYGNNGANVLNGGAGNDLLIGFGGADIFAFTTALGTSNVDAVADFTPGTDQIRLSASVFTGLAPGALDANAFNTGAAASDGSDRIIYNSATGALIFDADGAGGADGTVFATLSTGLAITASDFFVI